MSPLSDRAQLYARLSAGTTVLGLKPGAAALDRLLDYLELLARWNKVYNLTAVRDPDEMLTRHLLDSLAIAPLVRGDSLADLGTGAGLPGIPLAILEPARQCVLIDSNGKKTRFLREAVRTLMLDNVHVEQTRVETARGSYDCVTARAFTTRSTLYEGPLEDIPTKTRPPSSTARCSYAGICKSSVRIRLRWSSGISRQSRHDGSPSHRTYHS